jgi:vacuolar-type H+-ATPase subunit E/Vma4
MDDLQALTESIISKATDEAASIVANANQEAEEIAAAAKTKALEEAKKITVEYQRKAEAEERRIKIEAELEGRKMALTSKQQLVSDVFEKALQALKSLPSEKRIRFLAGRLADAGMQGGGEVIGAGSPNEWTAIISAANEMIARSGRAVQLTLSKEKPDFDGGFILKGPNYRVDCTYQAILEEYREALVPEIADYLFKQEKG